MVYVAAIGEVMVELAPFPVTESHSREAMALSFAGDTYNTAVYLARLGLRTDYVTNLGDDPYSAQILSRMGDENIGTEMISRMAGRSPGLYIIRNTANGEREFFYWRKESPARELFSTEEAVQRLSAQLENCNCVYLSGITLAIISESARKLLLQLLDQLRNKGVKIAFDSNFRPRLWKNIDEAQQAIRAVLARTDIALLTLDDEHLLWNDDSIAGCIARYKDYGMGELILKRGGDDTIIISANKEVRVPVPTVKNIVDTTGAGDTFNAGYLAARLSGKSIEDSAQQGNRCAGIVIRHRGGVIDKNIFLQELSTAAE